MCSLDDLDLAHRQCGMVMQGARKALGAGDITATLKAAERCWQAWDKYYAWLAGQCTREGVEVGRVLRHANVNSSAKKQQPTADLLARLNTQNQLVRILFRMQGVRGH